MRDRSPRVLRIAALEAAYPPPCEVRQFDMTMLSEAELRLWTSLPRDDAALIAHVNAPEYDWIPLMRLIERLKRVSAL